MYINETTSTLSDFITKLNTFLVGAGWTSDVLNTGAGKWGVSRTGSGYDVHFAVQWDTGSPNYLGVYQYLGAYNGGLNVYAQANDSGNGSQSTTDSVLDDARSVLVGNSPLQYWCFADDVYFHVVVETASGYFSHFGAGVLGKFGDWTGGEYVYGNKWSNFSGSTGIQVITATLLDGLNLGTSPAMQFYCATIHVESLPSQAAGGKYAVVMGNQGSADLGNDRQAVPKARDQFIWGFRAGPYGKNLSRFDGSDVSGHLPLYPIVLARWERGSGNVYGPMGYMKDVRGASIRNYVAGQELTIGGDTWVIFPTRAKWPGTGAYTTYSDYQGIAYKKIS